MKKRKFSKNKKRILAIILLVISLGIIYVFSVNLYVKNMAKDKILTASELTDFDADCVLVLGAQVKDTTPSPILSDRLKTGIELYNLGLAPKMLMSGDHGTGDYDEVNAMKSFATENLVPSENIFMDHAGFSTYESIYRAKEVFDVKKVIIVTQSYHLYRALFIADKLGLEAVGVASDLQEYALQAKYNMREVLARNKDFIQTIFKPKPKYLGDVFPINGDGNVTNDK